MIISFRKQEMCSIIASFRKALSSSVRRELIKGHLRKKSLLLEAKGSDEAAMKKEGDLNLFKGIKRSLRSRGI